MEIFSRVTTTTNIQRHTRTSKNFVSEFPGLGMESKVAEKFLL